MRFLDTFQGVAPHLDEVRSQANSDRGALGFIPDSAYRDLAAKERLWVAADERTNRPCGYLMFGGRYPHLKIYQLYVHPAHRGSGLGRRLLDKLIDFGRRYSYLTLSARVAADLPANAFWERAGFSVVRQVAGGETTGRLINLRLLELPESSLFGKLRAPDERAAPPSDLPVYGLGPRLGVNSYVLDLNVFFDIVRSRIFVDDATALFSAAMEGGVRLLVTTEFVEELNRHSPARRDDPVLAFAKGLPAVAAAPATVVDKLLPQMADAFFSHDELSGPRAQNAYSDLRHLITCIYHHLTGFVTRDSALLRHSEYAREQYGIEIVTPHELLPGDQRSGLELEKRWAVVSNKSVIVGPIRDAERQDAISFLSRLGIRVPLARKVVAAGTSSTPRTVVRVESEGNVSALAAWTTPSLLATPIDAYIYVDESRRTSARMVDHLLSLVIRQAMCRRFFSIHLYTAPSQAMTRETARALGFRLVETVQSGEDSMFVKHGVTGVIREEAWRTFSTDFRRRTGYALQEQYPLGTELESKGLLLTSDDGFGGRWIDLFSFETLISPGLIGWRERSAVMVPIQEVFAEELLTEVSRQMTFLDRQEAVFHAERAYFRRPMGVHLFPRGCPVVFYVSGKAQGRKEAIGYARITHSQNVSIEQAEAQFARQGVLSLDELRSKANEAGHVQVFTFDGFTPFSTGVSYRALKELGAIGGANLVTAQRISGDLFSKVVERGLGEQS